MHDPAVVWTTKGDDGIGEKRRTGAERAAATRAA
jgi:hypothetical protein